MSDNKKHSPIGASSMSRWARCPGSVRLSATVPPPPTSKYAEEGTRAHELAELILKGLTPKPEAHPKAMLEAVMVFVDAVRGDMRSVLACEGSHIFIEHGFDLRFLHDDLWGTCDVAIYYPGAKHLQIWDYKHGAGIPVEVDGNEQCKYYGVGALLTIKVDGKPIEVRTVETIIVQPRCHHNDGPIRRKTYPVQEIRDFADEIVRCAKATKAPNAPLVPGTHCRFCPAAGVCTEVHNRALAVAREEFSPTPNGVSPEKLGELLDWIPKFKAWIAAVEDFAFNEANQNRAPKGYKLVNKRGQRKWKDNVDAAILELTLDIPREKLTETSLLSPAQVEKLLPQRSKKELEAFVDFSNPGRDLVPVSDKREAAKLDVYTEFTALDESLNSIL